MQVDSRRILIVAHRPTDDSALLDAIAERARKSPAGFTLLVPAVAHGLHRVVDPEDQCCAEAEATLEGAIPVLSEAAGTPISGMIGSHDPVRRRAGCAQHGRLRRGNCLAAVEHPLTLASHRPAAKDRLAGRPGDHRERARGARSLGR